MKKLVLDARMINSSGIGRYIKSLIPKLRENFDLYLLVNSKPKEREIFFAAPIYSLKEQLLFPKVIPTCDIFWSPHFVVPIFPIRAKMRAVTIHDVYHLAHLNSFSLKEKIYAKIMYNIAVKRSNLVITVSNFSKSEIEKYTSIGNGKVEVIHNGIEINNREEPKNLFGLYFLFVGNWKPNKNLKRLIDAFSKIAIENPTISLIIIGKREGFINKEEEISLPKGVLILENVSDEELFAFYKNALALVFPSLYEGFGYPPLEAMALSCPVIVSDIPSCREVCKDAALYVDPFSSLDIYKAMSCLLIDFNLRASLIDKGLKRKEEFCLKKCQDEHLFKLSQLSLY